MLVRLSFQWCFKKFSSMVGFTKAINKYISTRIWKTITWALELCEMQGLSKSTSGKDQKYEFHLVHFHPLLVPMWVELLLSCLLTIFKISVKTYHIFKDDKRIKKYNYHHLLINKVIKENFLLTAIELRES